MKIAVLAGNKEEFRTLFRNKEEEDLECLYYYITEFNYRGMLFDKIIIIGTFWNRKNAKHLYSDLQLCVKFPYAHDIDFLTHEN